VSDRVAALLHRSRTELDAARVLLSAGFGDQAISRAYYGAFYAAEAALLSLGEGGFDPALGGELRRLFELRDVADYSWLDEPAQKGDDPLAAATRFVDGVERWAGERAR